ncbi:hypothetical protein OEV98_12300 [Caldibacillus lycopersici]|uniref:Uncharacterized protein n=1 Tax=Perspicuibacillus lycopersici TaxID=1325689 RepID=A0AAE3LNV6_9BACI|nr:hypothetical protein [Perspicuibacillus lycopersici]MCU9614321.1 hypothetical protein [Perspicuibacillus lycopersici]
MSIIEGNLLSGEFDQMMNAFILKSIKNIPTETSLSEKQASSLYSYLKRQVHSNEGQVISFYDQLLLPINANELKVMLADLENILEMYH